MPLTLQQMARTPKDQIDEDALQPQGARATLQQMASTPKSDAVSPSTPPRKKAVSNNLNPEFLAKHPTFAKVIAPLQKANEWYEQTKVGKALDALGKRTGEWATAGEIEDFKPVDLLAFPLSFAVPGGVTSQAGKLGTLAAQATKIPGKVAPIVARGAATGGAVGLGEATAKNQGIAETAKTVGREAAVWAGLELGGLAVGAAGKAVWSKIPEPTKEALLKKLSRQKVAQVVEEAASKGPDWTLNDQGKVVRQAGVLKQPGMETTRVAARRPVVQADTLPGKPSTLTPGAPGVAKSAQGKPLTLAEMVGKRQGAETPPRLDRAPTLAAMAAKPKGAAGKPVPPKADRPVNPSTIEQIEMDIIRALPKEINLPNKDYAVDVFDAAKQLASPARYKKLAESILGAFQYGKKGQEKIMLQTVDALATLSHEVGHSLDYRLGGGKFPSSIKGRFPAATAGEKALRSELKEVSNLMRPVNGGPAKFDKYRSSHVELMGDYYSLYMLDPEKARAMAPNVTAAFEEALKANPQLDAMVKGLLERRAVPSKPIPDVSAIKPAGEPRTPLPAGVGRSTEKAKELVKNTDRIYRYQVQEAAKRADDWTKGLTETQLEDIGAAVEGIGNLRTGKGVMDVMETLTPQQKQVLRQWDMESLTPRQKQVLRQYRFHQELARENVNKFLRDTGEAEYIKYIDDYLSHFFVAKKPKREQFIARWIKHSPNAKKRSFPTLQEAVDAGLTPLTQNVAELHKKWAGLNWRVATNWRFVYELKNIKNLEGLPVIMKPNKAPDGWPIVHHPAIQQIYAKKLPGGKTQLWKGGAAVDPEIYPIVKQIFEEPFTANWVKAIEGFNAYAKKSALSLSLFHHFALTESSQAALARGFNPLRGLLLAGKEGETALSGIKLPFTNVRITQPHLAGLKLLDNPEFRRDAALHGLTLDSIADVQVGRVQKGLMSLEAKTAKTPGVRWLTRKFRQANDKWDKALWNHYHSGLKAYSYYDLVKEALAKAPKNITDQEIRTAKNKIAELTNDMYGGQEWVSKFWLTPKGRQAMHIALLAPDWTISNIQVAGKAIKDFPDPVARRVLTRYWRNMLLSSGALVSGLNLAFSGKWPWENEVGHKFDIDVTSVMQEMPWVKDEKQRYYIKPGKQYREVLRYLENPIEIIGAKFSPAVHTVIEQFSGSGAGSGWDMPWVREDMSFYEGIPARAQSVAEKFIPFSARGNNFAFTFPMSKGMTPWKALRAYEDMIRAQVDPNLYDRVMPGARAKGLKAELDAAAKLNGLDADKMFKQANSAVRTDYYSKMWQAIEKQDMKKADRVAKILLELGVTGKTLVQSGERRGVEVEKMREAIGSLQRAVE